MNGNNTNYVDPSATIASTARILGKAKIHQDVLIKISLSSILT
jgi:carbonic anhydrase/acetyltransferase-like protein (isoleucine patch superfamily)